MNNTVRINAEEQKYWNSDSADYWVSQKPALDRLLAPWARLLLEAAELSGGEQIADIGCGTGLLGVEIRSLAKRLEGFDISQNMLAKAEEKALYDHLGQADLSLDEESSGLFIPTLAQHRADLVAAADVMMYLGSLETVMPLVSALLKPSGLFAFSVEEAGDEEGFILRESLRYAHSKSYVTELLERTGFSLIEIRKTTIRKDAGKPLSGILFLARAKA